jgi:hypothetical protein
MMEPFVFCRELFGLQREQIFEGHAQRERGFFYCDHLEEL